MSSLSDDTLFYKLINKLAILIDTKQSNNIPDDLIEVQNHDKLVKLLVETGNRCLRSIRNIGYISGVREYYEYETRESEYIFWHWNVEYNDIEGNWHALHQKSDADWVWMFGRRPPMQGGSLHVKRWAEIVEYIQDDLEPPPELEFVVNAKEHIKIGNMRSALLESVIGLEIVFSRYLWAYLEHVKGFTEERIKNFLRPEIGLTSRVSGLLFLTVDADILKKIDIKKVLAGIKWRNKIMHEKGKLPKEISSDNVYESITKIIYLSYLLGIEFEKVKAKPLFDRISNEIMGKYDLGWPTIKILGRHYITIEFFVIGYEVSLLEKHFNEIALNTTVPTFL